MTIPKICFELWTADKTIPTTINSVKLETLIKEMEESRK
jgi:hypothetical protein